MLNSENSKKRKYNYDQNMNSTELGKKNKKQKSSVKNEKNKKNNKDKNEEKKKNDILPPVINIMKKFDFKLIDKPNEFPSNKLPITRNQHKNEKCPNPNCNHKTFDQDPTPVQISTITEIESIDDFISIGKTYHCKKNSEYKGLNLKILFNLIAPLNELNDMIGMASFKNNIVNHLLFFLRGYNKVDKCNLCTECIFNKPCSRNLTYMLHTVITGPPGVGKTQIGKILGKLYKEMGILSKGHFTLVTRSDLIGKYLGHTAIKTQEVINSCIGGVMFIDEAYSLGNSEKRDSFSKECIDTLNQNLSENRNFLCIIAGYEKQLEECFFAVNDGLSRRFPFRYNIDSYSSSELKEIFLLKLKLSNWSLEFMPKETDPPELLVINNEKMKKLNDLFEDNYKAFPNYGGDIETLLLNCKIAHARRLPLKDPDPEPVKLNHVNSPLVSASTKNPDNVEMDDIDDFIGYDNENSDCYNENTDDDYEPTDNDENIDTDEKNDNINKKNENNNYVDIIISEEELEDLLRDKMEVEENKILDKTLTFEDITKAFEMYLESKNIKNKSKKKFIPTSIYH